MTYNEFKILFTTLGDNYICDSYVVSDENKEQFKSLRAERKLVK